MPVAQPSPDRQGPGLIPTTRSSPCRDQQVCHFGHRRHHDNSLQPALPPPTNNGCRPLHGLGVFDRGSAKFHHHQFLAREAQAITATGLRETVLVGIPSLSSLPVLARTSAFNSAAPAAPRIVLCDRTTNFQSNRLHSRKRPTVAAIPLPRILSNLGCGRSTLASYSTGWSGAVGRCNPLSGRNSFQASRISSCWTFFLNLTLTHSVCPSSTATRLQCALTLASNKSIFPPSSRPSNLPTSSCNFSSSFLMNGTTFPKMSSEATPGYPAPLTACIVLTNKLSIPNRSSSGFRASTSPIALQFGLVTI